jgi:hypothetical protein
MRRRPRGCTPSAAAGTKMWAVSARRALEKLVGRRPPEAAPPVYWGRIGAYEGVTRQGVLLLLGPEVAHPTVGTHPGILRANPVA